MTIKEVTEAFDSFFDDEKIKVMFFKGKWGCGKSYFVRKYLETTHSRVPCYQYFVSLFGLSSLQEVREAMDASLEIRPSSGGKAKKSLVNLGGKAGQAAELLKHLPDIPMIPLETVGKIGHSLFWKWTKSNKSCVVFDDLERADEKLKPHQVLGLASSMAENSQAKIIVIFNEDEIKGENLEKLNEYREKIADIELSFNPSIFDLVCHFSTEKSIKKEVVDILQAVDSTNIRLIFKINHFIHEFKTVVSEARIVLSQEELVRVAKLVCLRFSSRYPISQSMVESGFFGLSLGKDKASDDKKELSETVSKIRMFPPQPLDGLAFELIQNGHCSETSKKKYFQKYQDNSLRAKFNEDQTKAYSAWENNFSSTAEDLKKDVTAYMDEYAHRISEQQLFADIEFIKVIGIAPDQIETWIAKRIASFDPKAPLKERLSAARRLLPSQAAQKYIVEHENIRAKVPDPLGMINSILTAASWHPDDVELLDQMSEDQIFQWISTSNEERLIYSLRKTLDFWGSSTDEHSISFCNKLKSALVRVGELSDLNALKVKQRFALD